MNICFDLTETQKACDEWNFNCGPASLCAILNKTPSEIRPYLCDFEKKHYTNPKLMRQILDGMNIKYQWHIIPYTIPPMNTWHDNSLIRIQWDGPWTEPTRPMIARQRHTHWIACRHNGTFVAEIYDINAMCCGGWISVNEWIDQLVPWLLKECEPKANGLWWQTHQVIINNREI